MAGQRIGYARVSTLDQNEKRQLEGQVLDRVFMDKASGRDTSRPELTELLRLARDGDTVVVHSMDRLARNLDDRRALVQGLTRKGVRVEFIKESLVFTGEDSPMANLMLSVMGAFAEFERSLIRERQKEGIALAKQRGAYKGRKKTLTPERAAELVQRAVSGISKVVLARDYGISRETVYQYLRQARRSGTPSPAESNLLPQLTERPLSAFNNGSCSGHPELPLSDEPNASAHPPRVASDGPPWIDGMIEILAVSFNHSMKAKRSNGYEQRQSAY